jgi:hypothetical protein
MRNEAVPPNRWNVPVPPANHSPGEKIKPYPYLSHISLPHLPPSWRRTEEIGGRQAAANEPGRRTGEAMTRLEPGRRTGDGGGPASSGGRQAGGWRRLGKRAGGGDRGRGRATAEEAGRRRRPRGRATDSWESVDDGPELIDNDMNWSMAMGIGRRQRESSDVGWANIGSERKIGKN